MATADELLAGSTGEVEKVLTIDWESRTIDIPKSITNLGVEYDDDTKHLTFRAPKYYHGTDLTKFRVAVGYWNADDEPDVYYPGEVTSDDATMTFTWVVGPHAYTKAGNVEFLVYMLTTNAEGATEKRVGTTGHILPVLKGGNPDQAFVEQHYDAITSAVMEALERAQSTDLKGEPGYTPVKGVDYYTPEEEEALTQKVIQNANGAFANALKGTVSGEVIRVDDVSPIEHTVKAKVSGKNLLNDSVFKVETSTINGVTCTANDDGSYTVSGENTSSSFATFGSNRSTDIASEPIIPAGTYTPASGITVVCRDVATGKETNQQQTFAATGPFRIVGWYCYVSPNTSVLGGSYTKLPATFFPQLEKGAVATEYEPYINPVDVTVTACGKNILRPAGDISFNGVTITMGDSGIVTISGTSTAGVNLHIGKGFMKAGYKYKPTTGLISGSVELKYWNESTGIQTYPDSDGYLSSTVDTILTVFVYAADAGAVFNATFKPMVHLVTTNTDESFEPYSGITAIPSADGSVDIASVSPTMTLMTDTPGVTIEAEYSKDINKQTFGGNSGVDTDGITIKDRTTGQSYTLYVSNGKLMME